MTTPTKFCVDCKHFQGVAAPVECTAPQNEIVSPVFGDKDYNWKSAKSARANMNDCCGVEAKWFKAKEQAK